MMRAVAWAGGLCLAFPQAAIAQDAPDESTPPWSLSANAGATLTQGDATQWSAGVDLTRALGDGYLGVSFAHIDEDGTPGILGVPPARTDLVSLSGGYTFGALSLDVHGAYGWRKFGKRSFTVAGQVITSGGSGKSYNFGGGASYQIALDADTSLTPHFSIDFDRTDTSQFAVLPVRGPVFVKQADKGTTTGGGVGLDQAFGTEGEHSISLSVGYTHSSNAAAGIGSISGRRGSRPLRRRGATGSEDRWFDYGVDADFALSERLGLTVSANRTAGLTGPESTSLTAGVRVSF